jgi:D-arabinose 1-dehydrogenase-like Zn-dependent alcohol dehydrogenase
MKAAIVEQPHELVVRDIPEPQLQGDYDARCEMLYGAVCTGTDQHLIEDKFPWPVQYPTVLGHESIGRVVEVGSKVRHLKVGDVVTRVGTPSNCDLNVNWGGFVEQGIARDHQAMSEDGVPRAEWDSYRINQVVPPDIDPASATMMITWRETLSYITRLGIAPGSRVLVLGSGGNGNAFVVHAANLGAHSVAITGNANREVMARAVGATHFYDYAAPDLLERLQRDHSEGFDVIIDAVGKAGQMNAMLPLLKPGGTIGIYGLDDFESLAVNPLNARGTFTFYNGGYDEAETHHQVIDFMRIGKLNAAHWLNLEQPFALDNIHEAFDALRTRQLVKALVKLS